MHPRVPGLSPPCGGGASFLVLLALGVGPHFWSLDESLRSLQPRGLLPLGLTPFRI